MITLPAVLQGKQHSPEPDATPETSRRPPFVVEDRTSPEAIRRLAEVHAMRLWILSERARGNAPN